jgi:MFS transporter, ACS family, DAL5 transporter family protein
VQTAFTALLVIYCIVIGLVLAFRQYLARENKRRDREQGDNIDPEAKNAAQPQVEVVREIDETDWENESFRYYL